MHKPRTTAHHSPLTTLTEKKIESLRSKKPSQQERYFIANAIIDGFMGMGS